MTFSCRKKVIQDLQHLVTEQINRLKAIDRSMASIEFDLNGAEPSANDGGESARRIESGSGRKGYSVTRSTQGYCTAAHSGQLSTRQRRTSFMVEDSTRAAVRLSERVDEITTIVSTLRSIALQTHLLGINVIVEIARSEYLEPAFTSIAHEIRQLAERTRRCTANTSDIIHMTQSETRRAVTRAMVSETGR